MVPRGTLVGRALEYLAGGPADSLAIARRVLGLVHANRAIADRVVIALLGAHPRIRQLADGRWALAAASPAVRRAADTSFAVVDVETTGGAPGGADRVIEIGVAVLWGGRVELVFERLINPGRRIPFVVTALTGITDAMVAGAPRFEEVADALAAAVAGRVFVAHNAAFDWRFLAAELRRGRHFELDGPRLCTVRLARRLLPELPSRSLDALADYFGITIRRRHRAGGDALATAHILRRLLDLAEEKGIVTLDELVRAAEERRRARRTGRAAGP